MKLSNANLLPQFCSINQQLLKCCLVFAIINLFIHPPLVAQQHNRVETFTNANGLASNGCSDIVREPNGTIWVTHDQYYQSPSLYNHPISKRNINGTWEYPSLASLPQAVVNGNTIYNDSYRFSKVFRSSNGNIWFVPKNPGRLMNPPPPTNGSAPLVVFNGIAFSALHPALNNFPDKGGVIDMVEDNDHNIWFACASGLIKMSSAGVFTTYTPPNFVYTTSTGHVTNVGATKIISIDIDANNHPVMIVETAVGDGGNGLVGLRYVRRFKPATNEWDLWTLRDAPWLNAAQNEYNPIAIKASRNKDNRILISSFGGGMYYIDNNNYNSNDRTQIANFLTPPLWGTWGWSFDIIRTNLSDFPSKIFKDATNSIWTLASTSAAVTEAYRYEKASPTTFLWNGSHLPATRHSFARRGAQITFNNNGATQRTNITGMSFAPANEEIWVSTEHGVERWYSYYPFPNSVDFIGIEGAGNHKVGIAAFNALSNNLREPAAYGHKLTPGTPTISIDSAYYYLSTTDYDRIDSTVEAGLRGDGVVQGFPALTAALQANNLTTRDISIRFTPVSLGEDSVGAEFDWTYSNPLEKRRYQKRIDTMNNYSEVKSHYEILLGNGNLLFKGEMPTVHLGIEYNKHGYLMDSVAAHTDDVRLTRNQFITGAVATTIANAIEQDLGNHGVRFVFQSIQSANDTSINNADRLGGLFKINFAYLRKSDTAMALLNPLAGFYKIGNSVHAHFPNITSAVNALQTNGISAWVTFLLENGVYNEQFALPAIAGTNGFGNRPITFKSLNNDSTKVTIQFSPAIAANNYVFRHNGVKNLQFQQLHLKNSSATLGRVIHVNAAANTFKLNNCIIEGNADAPATIDNDLLTVTSSFANANINNSIFLQGNRSLNLIGSGIKVIDNTFRGHKNYAINFGSANAPEVSRNKIYGPSTGTFSGISMGSANNAFIVQQNKIVNTQVPGVIGINVTAAAAGGNYEGGNARVWNNEVVMATSATTEGIVAQSDHSSFYHNTVHLVGNNATSTAVRCGLVRANLKVENNIFSNPNGYAMVIWRSASGGGSYYTESNHNIYHGSATPFKIHSSVNVFINYNNIAALRAVNGRDANSREANPQFISSEILIPQNGALYNIAPTIAALTTDIRNRVRPNTNRDHGAYEFNSWSGAVSGNWQVAGNWTDGIVPNENGMAVLPGNGVSNELVLTQPITINNMYVAAQRNIIINAAHTLNVTGTLMNNGIIGGSGFVKFNNGEQQLLGGTGSIRHLVINNNAGVTIPSGESNAIGVLESLSINSGKLFTNNNLILKSTQVYTASVGQLNPGAIVGKVTVERYIPAKRAWRTLTAPLKGTENNSVFYNWQNNGLVIANTGAEIWGPAPFGTANPTALNSGLSNGGGYSLRQFNNGWINVNNTNTTNLFNAQTNNSYLLFITGGFQSGTMSNGAEATTLKAKGELIIGNHSVQNLANQTFNLIGNPYASTIDFEQLQKNNIQNRFWIWDPNRTGANNVGGYVLFDMATQTTTPATPVGSYINFTSYIQSGQAFFVYANAGNGSIEFNETAKISTPVNSVFRASANRFEKMVINLFRTTNNVAQLSDGVTALFDSSASTLVTNEDALKLPNSADNISLMRHNQTLMLERRPFVTVNDTLFIRVSNMAATTYELRLAASNFDATAMLSATLKDLYLNTSTNLQLTGETVYAFTTNADTNSRGDRFMITFQSARTLPLQSIVLTANKQHKNIAVKWLVKGEYDMEKYQVEKSADGLSFKTIAETIANNSATENIYAITDEQPFGEINYYRIKAINKNGSFVYSSIARVQFNKEAISLQAYPNPAKKGNTISITLKNMQLGLAAIQLLSLEGKTIWQSTVNNNLTTTTKQLTIPTHIAAGNYILEVIDATGNKSNTQLIIY